MFKRSVCMVALVLNQLSSPGLDLSLLNSPSLQALTLSIVYRCLWKGDVPSTEIHLSSVSERCRYAETHPLSKHIYFRTTFYFLSIWILCWSESRTTLLLCSSSIRLFGTKKKFSGVVNHPQSHTWLVLLCWAGPGWRKKPLQAGYFSCGPLGHGASGQINVSNQCLFLPFLCRSPAPLLPRKALSPRTWIPTIVSPSQCQYLC